jgi:hypothetical protein
MPTVRASWVVALGFAALTSGGAAAQNPDAWVTIIAPSEWRAEPLVRLMASVGESVRIEGQAFHPDSIVSVSVNGRNATISRDNIGVVTFTFDLQMAAGVREVRIVARSVRDSIPRQFPVVLESGGAGEVPPFFPTVLVPGMGQFQTGRGGLGAVVLGASLGAAAAGVLITQKEVLCATRTSSCEESAVLASSSSRPYLIPGLVAAVAISAVGAWQAGKSAPSSGASGAADSPSRLADLLEHAGVGVRSSGVELSWQLRRF